MIVMKMINLNLIIISYASLLVISTLLINQIPSANSILGFAETKNETFNEITDSANIDKYKVSKGFKNYLNVFDGDQLTNRHLNQFHKNNKTKFIISNILNNSKSFNNLNQTILNNTHTTSNDTKNLSTSDQINFNITNQPIWRDPETNNQTLSQSRETINSKNLFKSMCSLINNQVEGCERYECNKNACYCNDLYNETINLKPNWPIKYMCLNKVNYNEACLIDEQCGGKHEVCLNKKKFQNYLNFDPNVLSFNESLEKTIKKSNNYSFINQELLIKQMLILYNHTSLKEYRGKCRCKLGYFYNYYLSYSNKNKHFNKQFNLFLIENNNSNIGDLFVKQKNLFMGHCLKVKKLDETCELNSECQMNDLSSICKKSKCVCKNGFQIETRNKKFSQQISNQTNSVLLNRLIRGSENLFNLSKLICEPILDLNNGFGHNQGLVKKKINKNNSSVNYQDLNRNNVQIIENFLNKNCSDELIICEGGQQNCLMKTRRLHIQDNFVSLVWTILCMFSIMLVLCMLLVKNKQDGNLESNHNYNNYFLRNSLDNNLNHQSNSFLGNIFNRSHLNQALNATELQSINERNLISYTPPPEFEFDEQPPSYQEAIRLMQPKPNPTRDIS